MVVSLPPPFVCVSPCVCTATLVRGQQVCVGSPRSNGINLLQAAARVHPLGDKLSQTQLTKANRQLTFGSNKPLNEAVLRQINLLVTADLRSNLVVDFYCTPSAASSIIAFLTSGQLERPQDVCRFRSLARSSNYAADLV